MGLLLKFLQLCTGDATSHRLALNSFAHADRVAARRLAESAGHCADLFRMERDACDDDVDGEPIVLP